MAKAAFTINLAEEKQGFFCRVPLRMGQRGRKQSPTARAIAGKIFGVSSKKGSPSCWTSYDQMQEEFGVCRSTVATSLGTLKENKLIEEKKRDRDGTAYTYVGEASRRYNIVPLYLFTADVVVDGKQCRLTKAQVLLLSHLMTETKRPKNNGKYEGSIAQLARELALSETTVKKALSILMKARLIYRPAEDKGKNGHKLTRYSVAKELFEYERKRRIRAAKAEKTAPKDKNIENLNALAERNSYYEKMKARMMARADKYLRAVTAQVPQYDIISKKLKALNIEQAKAEVRKLPTLNDLQAQRRELEEQRRALMQRYKISEERMRPEYYATCKRCLDTGELPGGQWCMCHKKSKEGNA